MPTTTNFGWTTPADTDLVKDGAAAIRTFAGNVDTSLVDLKGGTTGQYLQKNSGTDLDYVWADVSAGGMTLINTGGTTLTGSSVTISSIPATYNDLRIIVRNFRPATDNDALVMRLNNDSGANRHLYTTTNSATNQTFDATYILISGFSDNGASNSLSATTIYDYANTATFKMCQTHASIVSNATTPANLNYRLSHGYYNQTTAISSLTFLCDTGGNFTSGTVFVYGVK